MAPVTEPGPLQPPTYSLPERPSTELTVSQNSHSSQDRVPEFPVSGYHTLATSDAMTRAHTTVVYGSCMQHLLQL